MKQITKLAFIAMLVMAITSFGNLLGINIAGISVCIGVVFFFVNKRIQNQSFEGCGFDIKAISSNLKEKRIYFWMAMPLIMDIVSITIGKLFIPEYIEHVLTRTEIFISFDKIILLIIQLLVLALGEEIAWRAFFQNQLQKMLPIAWSLIITSLLFAIGHIASGNIAIIIFDIFFVFINSILYGIIFKKTNNAWMSTIAHFLANLFSIIILVFI